MLSFADVQAAALRIEGHVLRTPTLPSAVLSRMTGAEIYLKLDNLQAVGSFKERGAANRLALLTPEERKRGVVAMSAGNHAQGVARHATRQGVAATIVMPKHTPLAKVSGTAAWGATVVLHGATVEEAAAHARHLAVAEGLVFIHPYDDPAVMAGQGTLALEMFEDAPPLDLVVVPIGGGGLISGCAVTAAAISPSTEVIGVQVAPYSALAQRLGAAAQVLGGATIAEGIAVKDVGSLTARVIASLVKRVLVAPELVVEDAIAMLAEAAKVVAEGAGAAGLAGVLAHREIFAGKRVGLVVCGGNIDSRILANVLLRGLLRDGRLLRIRMDIPDRPGVLADIAARIGRSGGNIIEVSHQRLFASPSVQAAQLEVMVEARDPLHAAEIEAALAGSYTVTRI
ncbi:MAG: threonine ammonia-lyase [Rhodospirillales bacterium]